MNVVIFANGDLPPQDLLTISLNQSELLIAADGGAGHCHKLGITPDLLLGDLDSIDPAILDLYKEHSVEIVCHPAKKSATDLELAMDMAKARGAAKIHLIGVLGGRWDMSLGNIFLAASAKYSTIELTLAGPDCLLYIFHPDKLHRLTDAAGRRVSLFPMHGDVHGVSLNGFAYTLLNRTISAGSSLGTSNVMLGGQATVRLKEGTLLCVQTPDG